MGTFADHHDTGREVWRAHAMTEYRLGENQRLLLDGGYSRGEGWMAMALSDVKGGIQQGSLRLAYESETLRGQLFWNRGVFTADFSADLEFSGIRLATLLPVEVTGDVLDAEVSWTLPTFWDPLLIMVGANGRFSRVTSDELLDGDTFSDPLSENYHQPGIDRVEGRGGAFLHMELAPFDWMTLTGGLRFDYNTVTDEFLSPRVAAVFRPADGHFLRVGIARSFRKPAFFETGTHLMVGFPDDSPITGTDQLHFQEFMSGVLGDTGLRNEELVSYEAGYLGRFLESDLIVSLDLYYNEYKNEVVVYSDIVADERGIPDLDATVLRNINIDEPLKVAGCELTIRYSPTTWLSLLATWTWREPTNRTTDASPKHMFSVGGRLKTDSGLVGSLFAFTRSEFWDRYVPNPKGLFEDFETDHLETAVLFLARLGWRWSPTEVLELEAGLKMFFPFAPWSDSLWRYRELGGGITAAGENFGGDLLRRVVIGYLEGSF